MFCTEVLISWNNLLVGLPCEQVLRSLPTCPAIRLSLIVVKLMGLKQRLNIAYKNHLCAVCFLMEALSFGWACSRLRHCGPVSLSRIVCTYCGLHSRRLLVLTLLLWCWMTPGVHQFVRNPQLWPDWHVCSC